MSFLEIAKERYTTKKYDGTKKIPVETIKELIEIIRLSPSSINSQPWKFVFISNEDLKNKFSEVSYHNVAKVQNASHLVVFLVLDNVDLFEEQIKKTIPQGSVDYYYTHVKPLGEIAIKSWMIHQVYLSLGFFLSAAASLGLDSTPMEGIENDKYDDMLQIKNYKTTFAVALGYRDVEDFNQPSKNPKSRLEAEKTISMMD